MLSIVVSQIISSGRKGEFLSWVKPEIQIYSILVKRPLFCLAHLSPDNLSVGDLSFIHFTGYFLVYKMPVAQCTEKRAKELNEIYSLQFSNWHSQYKPFFTENKGCVLWKIFEILQRSTKKSNCERTTYLSSVDCNWEEQKTDS